MEPRSIEDREDRVKEIDQRIGEIDQEFANTRMTDEVREEWNNLNAERDQHEGTVKELKARRERLRAIAGNPAATERAQSAPEAPAFVRKRGDEIYDLTRIRAEARSEDDHRTRLHDHAKRAIEQAHFPTYAGSRSKVQEHVEDLLARCDDDQGTLAKRILATGNPVYDRAYGKLLTRGGFALSPEESRAMALNPDTAGGFAVPFDLDPTVILTNDGALSPLRQIARVEQTVSKTWQGITSEGITVTRSLEGDEADDNSFTIAQPEVSPQRVIADVRFSVEIDQDWTQLRNDISRLLMDAKGVEEDTAFVIGNGVAPNPEGAVTGLDAGSEVPLGAPGTITSDDLFALEEAVPVRFRSRGQFIGNKSTYNDVRSLGSASDGGDLWVRLASGQPSELLGYPAFEASAMDSAGAADNRILMFGDWQQFLIVDRIGMLLELNAHVTGASGRWTGQRAVVAVWRNSSLVLVDNAFRVLVDVSV
jgi:HK97 family phage major capsid protein